MLKKKRDSSTQVNSNGFALFVVGLTFAGFLGGAMRLFLNSERAQTQILDEVQRKFPKWNVRADRVELRLASGIWPGVTVELPRAHASKQGACGKPSFDVDVRDLKVPVGLWSLLWGNNRLGHVTVAQVDVQFQKNLCRESEGVSNAHETLAEDSATSRVFRPGLRKIYEEVQRRASGVTLGEVNVHQADDLDWSLRARNLNLEAGAQVTVNSQVSVWKKFEHGEVRQDFALRLGLQGPLLEWQLRSALKEGNFTWSGQVDEEGRTFLQRFFVKQGPLGDFLSLLHRAGFLEKPPETKRVWVNCGVVQSGSFGVSSSIAEMPVRLDHCKIDGELGKVEAEPNVFYLKAPYLRNGDLTVHLRQLSVDQVADVLAFSKMKGVFSSLGSWSGAVQFHSLKKIRLKGKLENLKVKVSNKSLRGTEILSGIETSSRLDGNALAVEFSNFQILGGSSEGHAEFKYNLESGAGSFEALFPGLSPSASIQNLLFEGQMTPVRLKAGGHWEQGQVSGLKVGFSANEAKGQGWRLSGLEGTLKQTAPEKFSLDLSADRFLWQDSFKYDPLVESVAKVSAAVVPSKELKTLHAHVNVDSSGGNVQEASAVFVPPTSKISFQGHWKRGDRLIGKVRLGPKRWVPVEVTPRSGHLLQ